MTIAQSAPPTNQIITEFIRLALGSPVAIVTLVLSWFSGYGISFVLFDYRRSNPRKSHYWFHAAIGLGYTAVVFITVNLDILTRSLTVDQIARRIPLTLLVSVAAGFVIMLSGAIWREIFYSKPKRSSGGNGN